MEPTAGEEPPAKKKKGEKGYPPGILDHRTGKLQARLPGFKVDGKACQKPIPGLHDNVEVAVAEQAKAQQKLEHGGPEAVWPNWAAPQSQRNGRGQVRCALCTLCCQLASVQLMSTALLACVHRAQSATMRGQKCAPMAR